MFALITFVLVLSLLVFVHEFGHFWTARKLGVKVDEFGFGFPPRIIGIQKLHGKWKIVGRKAKAAQHTIYSLNWIPLGGFVKIKGEQGEQGTEKDSFGHKPIYQRVIILSAGVVMNILLAFVLLSWGFALGLPQIITGDLPDYVKLKEEKIQVIEVLPGFPAAIRGVEAGDQILSIDQQEFSDITAIQQYLSQKNEIPVTLALRRGDRDIITEITPRLLEQTQTPGLGVSLVETAQVSYPIHYAILEGAKTTAFLLKEIIVAFYELIANMFGGGKHDLDVAGPVGIAVITGQVARLGFIYLLQFTALLSLNLAVINFLPIPALDGGRVLFLAIEKIRGKAINQRIEATVHNIAFMLLILIVLIVSFRDVLRFSDQFAVLWQSLTNIF